MSRAFRAHTPFLILLILSLAGCSQKWVSLRTVPRNPLGDQLQLGSFGGPQPSARTVQLLRVYNLTDELSGDSRRMLQKLQVIAGHEPSADNVYALAELAYLGGKKAERGDPRAAFDLYGAAVLHAYSFLFDDRFAGTRNCYDPEFRGACDLYNGALESMLRIASRDGALLPGAKRTINTAGGSWEITCSLRGSAWRPEDFGRFEFVSDYEMNGLKNRYQTHGLGVPLIAVRRSYPGQPAAARYYPTDLSFPVTAFLRPLSVSSENGKHQGLLELYDPLVATDTSVGRLTVPLESDLTTPLAYGLSKVPLENVVATVALLRPEKLLAMRPDRQTTVMGLYMVQPYEPGKIPVLLVHGLWSSPMTWMEMFNDLRSSPDIRRHYQFWFYLYPTGQPFWLSAAQLRYDLAEVRQVLDPQHREPALDQMVLVGHSMGGLVARLQTVESGDNYWALASHMQLDAVKTEPETRQKLHDVFFFHPNPSIRRVITIATPHHGSSFSNQTTQYLLGKLIQLPDTLANTQQKLFRDNKDLLFAGSLLTIQTSIDALAYGSPIFPVLLASPHPPWVKYHNIVGELPPAWWRRGPLDHGDGVVADQSARVEGVHSELIVPADHTTVHCHPLAVMEVRRILHEHLAEVLGAASVGQQPRVPVRR